MDRCGLLDLNKVPGRGSSMAPWIIAGPAKDDKTGQRVAWLDEKDYPGLPVIWIENQGLRGAQTYASLRAAWQRAERRKTSERGGSGQASYRQTVNRDGIPIMYDDRWEAVPQEP